MYIHRIFIPLQHEILSNHYNYRRRPLPQRLYLQEDETMKETDLIIIRDAINAVLAAEEWTFYETADKPQIVTLLMHAYLVADREGVSSAHLRSDGTTIIIAPALASYIRNSRSSLYRARDKFVQYEDVFTDIYTICEAIQLAYLRI